MCQLKPSDWRPVCRAGNKVGFGSGKLDSQVKLFLLVGKMKLRSIGKRFRLVMWTWQPSGSRLDAAEALAVRRKDWRKERKD